MGSYKFVMASSREAVHEMLVKKSADYAGRPQTYAFYTQTLGKLVGSKVSDISLVRKWCIFAACLITSPKKLSPREHIA